MRNLDFREMQEKKSSPWKKHRDIESNAADYRYGFGLDSAAGCNHVWISLSHPHYNKQLLRLNDKWKIIYEKTGAPQKTIDNLLVV